MRYDSDHAQIAMPQDVNAIIMQLQLHAPVDIDTHPVLGPKLWEVVDYTAALLVWLTFVYWNERGDPIEWLACVSDTNIDGNAKDNIGVARKRVACTERRARLNVYRYCLATIRRHGHARHWPDDPRSAL